METRELAWNESIRTRRDATYDLNDPALYISDLDAALVRLSNTFVCNVILSFVTLINVCLALIDALMYTSTSVDK